MCSQRWLMAAAEQQKACAENSGLQMAAVFPRLTIAACQGPQVVFLVCRPAACAAQKDNPRWRCQTGSACKGLEIRAARNLSPKNSIPAEAE